MSKINYLTGRQVAAARALLGLEQAELASLAGISAPTLRRMESSKGEVSGYAKNVIALRTALESAGVTFLEGGTCIDGGPGVRLRKD